MNYRELIEQNDKEAIKKATEEGFDPNGKDETLLAWLVVALRSDCFNSMEGLLQAGASPEGPHGDPLSPLMVAVKMRKLPAVDLLLRHGANPDRPLPKKETALHLATSGAQSLAIVERLLAADANPKVADERGWTALMKAASEGNAEVVERLIKAGADLRAGEIKTGKTAWDLANAAGHSAVCEILDRTRKIEAADVTRRFDPPDVTRKIERPAQAPKPKVAPPSGEPAKPWQIAIVILVGLLASVGMYYKVVELMNP